MLAHSIHQIWEYCYSSIKRSSEVGTTKEHIKHIPHNPGTLLCSKLNTIISSLPNIFKGQMGKYIYDRTKTKQF